MGKKNYNRKSFKHPSEIVIRILQKLIEKLDK